jgi:hypothetical protein
MLYYCFTTACGSITAACCCASAYVKLAGVLYQMHTFCKADAFVNEFPHFAPVIFRPTLGLLREEKRMEKKNEFSHFAPVIFRPTLGLLREKKRIKKE